MMKQAVTSTTPTTMSYDGESIFSRTMPERSDSMMTAPGAARNRADATRRTTLPDDRGGDDVGLVLHTKVHDRTVEASGLDGRARREQEPHQRERAASPCGRC